MNPTSDTLTHLPPPEHADVLVIGTGFAGLGTAARLKRRGTHSFVVLERADDVGGTWRDNTYPGAACDVPSHLYSFSFRPNPDWSRLFARGPEIHRYLRDTARDEGLLPHIRFGAEVTQARWDTVTRHWVVTTARGVFTGRFLVTGTGHLSDHSLPDIPGLAGFDGPVFHSARWDHGTPLAGKRVAVVGSGASAVQIVPEVAEAAAEVVVFQRSAPYVVPRPDRAYTDTEKRVFRRDPEAVPAHRAEIFWYLEAGYAARRAAPHQLAEAKAAARAHLERQVADPELRAALTPDYELGCKRVLISDTYYPALTRDHVRLEPSALAQLEPGTAVAASGARHAVDVVVLCTGFETAEPPYAHLVHDGAGTSLAEHWAQGMEAYASTTVAGFPNLFLVNGPNTGLGHNSIVHVIEAQVTYVLGALDWSRAHGDHDVEVTPAAQRRYTGELARRGADTVWHSRGCESWYLDPRSGRLTLIWPDFADEFRHRNGTFDPPAYRAPTLTPAPVTP
ncbi:NAD(P)/FAD-dependent oxidoreductase [Streptomyces sp. LP11]|uniref:NAD(P)/FAD-dependent oxidoreductase n=1 Tax=Streptomyces pyxinicus TaxID=2970331 RepID=A0ABT2AYR7_9ACTN|nr:NAD(P)/FAD-dependent oxidoreductase [Streptomyces sp. LP11]MCS0601399.1 NAD(P)/FAD-dependent oxidoreductase [Streptomyces sp. LP11]